MNDARHQRIVREAAELMGRAEVAGRLKVDETQVIAWIDGLAPVPQQVLMALAEVLVSWSGKQRF